MIEDTLRAWAARKGYDIAWGPGTHLRDVQAEISGRGARGELAPDFVEKWLGWVREPGSAAATPETVIAVAVPCPAADSGSGSVRGSIRLRGANLADEEVAGVADIL